MRVLLTADTVGGVWDYAVTLAGELAGRGNRVLLAVVGRPAGERLRDLPAGVEVESREFRLEWMPGGVDEVHGAAAWLRELAGRWGAGVAHLNQLAYSALPFPGPTLVVTHSDVRSWFRETLGTDAPAEWDAYARAVGAGIRAADALVAPSRYQSELTRAHYGRAADRVIHNGVRPPTSVPAPRSASLVIAVGRAWDEAKGMRTLDEAIGLLGRDAPRTAIYGALDGPHGQRFAPRHALARGSAPRAEVDAAMRSASLFVGASLYEPFGLAPLEAALHGCPLLLSDIPSFRELWDGCADFFAPGDARALAEGIRRLQADAARRAELARRAGERARTRYGVERMADAYEALYRELAGTASAPPVRHRAVGADLPRPVRP